MTGSNLSSSLYRYLRRRYAAKSCRGAFAIKSSGKAIEYSFRPTFSRRGEFENHTVIVCPTSLGGPVEVPQAVKDYRRDWASAIS